MFNRRENQEEKKKKKIKEQQRRDEQIEERIKRIEADVQALTAWRNRQERLRRLKPA